MENIKPKRDKFNLKLLYVEDEETIREQLVFLLQRRVSDLVVATNGKEGLDKFKDYRPDIVVTDIRMPFMDGLEMSKNIREIDKDVVIIITTAHSETEYFLNAIDIGVDKFLIKPIRKQNLDESLAKFAKDIEIKKEFQSQQLKIQTLLNFIDDIIIVTDGKTITDSNYKFLNFFGYNTLSEFLKDYSCICDRFVEDSEYLQKDINGKNWLEFVVENQSQTHKVKLYDNGNQQDKIFIIKAVKLPIENSKEYIVSFIDITNIELESKNYQAMASTDHLTKIYNRYKFNKALNVEIERAKELEQDLCLIIFDIDYFKKINDTYGHQIGDKVLVSLTELVSKNIRQNDLFARWGGEEFMLIMPSCDEEHAKILAEKLRKLIETNDFEKVGQVTCSFGVILYNGKESIDDLIKKADIALYKAKQNGRNRVEVF
ncbi:MAG: diguanylate cyclase [Campylobacterales bacterium]|nr:diguanylate cyclase [Campylobacterales bacterium]